MKKLCLMLLVLLLASCASKYKSSEDVELAAMRLQAQMGWQRSDGQPLDMIIIEGRQVLRPKVGKGGTMGLSRILLQARENPNKSILFIANIKAKFDYMVLFNVMDGMDLRGVKFILVARKGYKEQFESVVKATGADFAFIDRLKI